MKKEIITCEMPARIEQNIINTFEHNTVNGKRKNVVGEILGEIIGMD